MKTGSFIILVVTFVVFISCGETFANESDSVRAIQILAPVNHSFHLELTDLREILGRDDVKDHHAVVVSIAGAFRQGKSFLLNFFIKYLQAQVSGINLFVFYENSVENFFLT